MRDLFIPGASYAAATPEGDLVCSMAGTAFVTNGAPIPACPGGGLLAPDAVRIGSRLCVAGHGMASFNAWLWTGIAWVELALGYGQSQVRFGPRGLYLSSHGAVENICLYDPLTGAELGDVRPDGTHTVRITKPLGSEGLAAITGAGTGPNDVHAAKDWYGRDGFGFYSEFDTSLGRVTIGQSAGDGILAKFVGGPVKRVAFGNSQFVVPNQDGDRFSIAVSRFGKTPAENIAGALWLTAQEIAALPDVVAPVEPPPIVIVPPVKPPEPEPMAIPDHGDLSRQLAAQFPFPKTVAGAFSHTRRLAWALRGEGCGLLSKPAGENIITIGSETYSAGRVCYPDGQIFKVLSDVGDGGANGPQWANDGTVEASRYRPALAPSDAGPVDLGEPTSGLLQIDTALLEGVLASLVDDYDDLAARVAALEARPQEPPTSSFPTRIALKTDNGHYLCAEDGGGGVVNATRDAAGGWETFTVEDRT